MTTDQRLWAKVDLGYFSNPKMSDVLDASSNAVCMHLASILHSAQHLTDGHVSPRAMQRAIGGDASDTALLVENGLWHEPGHDCDDCPQPDEGRVYVHDYLKHNTSSDTVERRSKNAKRAAQARWKKKKPQEKTPTKDDADSNANSMRPAYDPHASRMPNAMQDAMPNAMLDRLDRLDRLDTKESTIADAIERPAETVTADDTADDLEPRPDIDQILDTIDAHCDHHGFKKPGRTKKNHTAARLMLDRDERPLDEVVDVLRFVTMSDFWPDKIRSAVKLREKYDQLKYQAQRAQTPTTGAPQRMTADQRRLQVGLDREQRIMQGQLGDTLAALEA